LITRGLPTSSRRRRTVEGRVLMGGWRKKKSAIEVDVGVGGAKSEIKVESRCGHEWSAEDFSESVREITVVGIVVIVIVGHHSARISAYLFATSTFACTLASSLVSTKQEDGRRAEGPEEAL